MDISSVAQARFLLGKNAESNWNIYKASEQTDTIFHVDKLSSPYVIVNVPVDDLSREQISAAAILCKSKSKHRLHHDLEILYTPISNTYLGDKLGMFIIKNNNKKKIIKI